MLTETPSGPRDDEIVVAIAVTDSGRPHPRVGGLTKDKVVGIDGALSGIGSTGSGSKLSRLSRKVSAVLGQVAALAGNVSRLSRLSRLKMQR